MHLLLSLIKRNIISFKIPKHFTINSTITAKTRTPMAIAIKAVLFFFVTYPRTEIKPYYHWSKVAERPNLRFDYKLTLIIWYWITSSRSLPKQFFTTIVGLYLAISNVKYEKVKVFSSRLPAYIDIELSKFKL